jgi:hypothetical protein
MFCETAWVWKETVKNKLMVFEREVLLAICIEGQKGEW